MSEIEFKLPDIGEGIDAAEVVQWLAGEGDSVKEDQPLVEVQTDKAIVVIPCPTTGALLRHCAAEGERVAVGNTLAVFASAATTTTPTTPQSASPPPPPPTPAAAAAEQAATPAASGSPSRGPLASPAVRRFAREQGVDLASVCGSGPGGRVSREDVVTAAAALPAAQSPRVASLPPQQAGQVVPLRGVRRAIAHALTDAWQTVPHVIDYREVDATQLVAARRALKEAALAHGDEPLASALTVTPLIVKIAARTLRRHPYVNASIDLEREEITLHAHCHVGVATATPEGLMVPVVRDADLRSTHEIALEIVELSDAAREQHLAPPQLSGGTFTVNNYGGLGIWLGTPIVKPPEVANLGIGRLREQAVVVDGEIVVRPIVPLAVSGDHRVLDGHTLAAFVTDIVAAMEDPHLLLGELR